MMATLIVVGAVVLVMIVVVNLPNLQVKLGEVKRVKDAESTDD